jgi:hypothetical protein
VAPGLDVVSKLGVVPVRRLLGYPSAFSNEVQSAVIAD